MIVEILIYLVAAISALCITGYAMHMFIGGLVSPEAENQFIILACLIVAGVIAYMTWDVIQRRTGRK
jgi:Na+/H+ antiporter NhaA